MRKRQRYFGMSSDIEICNCLLSQKKDAKLFWVGSTFVLVGVCVCVCLCVCACVERKGFKICLLAFRFLFNFLLFFNAFFPYSYLLPTPRMNQKCFLHFYFAIKDALLCGVSPAISHHSRQYIYRFWLGLVGK